MTLAKMYEKKYIYTESIKRLHRQFLKATTEQKIYINKRISDCLQLIKELDTAIYEIKTQNKQPIK